ncbi:MAG: hypothetical protein ACKVP7_05225 [Hyphomicrobiaceae bacterium]
MTTPTRSDRPALVAASPVAAAAGFNQAFLELVDRIDSVLAEERDLLAQSSSDQLERVITRKNHLIVEISRFHLAARGWSLAPHVRARLEQVRLALGENAQLLQRHIGAVNEISSLVADICNRATSDGTYTIHSARTARKT